MISRVVLVEDCQNDIVDIIHSYLSTFVLTELDKEMIQLAWLNLGITRRPSNKYIDTLDSVGRLIKDQLGHFNDVLAGDKCWIWYIVAQYNGFDYGSICVFYNPDKPIIYNGNEGIVIQDIVKYPIPTIAQMMFPINAKTTPKLNSILEPPISSIALSVGLMNIYVRPIGKQGDILEKYYGYTKLPLEIELNYPCETISEGFDEWYYKTLE